MRVGTVVKSMYTEDVETMKFYKPSRLGIERYRKALSVDEGFSAPGPAVSCFIHYFVVTQENQNKMVVTEEKREDQLSLSERCEIRESARELLASAGEENWDGENALPILPETVKIAEDVVDLFPSSGFLPEVSATPHGEIDFDWVISKDIMLTVSVCPAGKIAYSGIFNIQGSEEWNDQLPSDVVCWLTGLQKMPTE